MKLTPQEIAQLVQARHVEGLQEKWLTGFARLGEAQETDIAFFADPRYENELYATQAGVVLLSPQYKPKHPLPPGPTWIYVDKPEQAFYMLVQRYKAPSLPGWGREAQAFIHPTAVVSEKSYIGAFAYVGERSHIAESVWIFPFAYIGPEVEIGAGTVVYPHAVIMPGTKIGRNCIVHPGAIIGADGFGFYKGENRPYERIPQIGHVVIEDDVEIGANTCVDRATLGATHLAHGVKLDNLIQVGHNVRIGAHTAIAAQTGIAGSSTIGAYCRIGGQVGIVDHVHIADNTSIAAQSGISKSILVPGKAWRGAPAQEVRQQLLMEALMRKLPELYPRLRELEKALSQP
ncbi:MAG: UDP-3-O-(3-hydroxymyristoyl)glucosamine N-acyltransferase [Bacteroidia bacterium]|jgi:UDP-3-O-[3-hydroxymyristoyl] glucosamine N-acyltransferase|nr:UDP-3-O-(3-hydroxymyristoyl)glucosamine N-acyltransferase [Bacteroidia bacterium]GIV22659.1 MAG: UDP-3-O-acylglucosamine N-acyltransferase [Bacteroidia bacterium]